MAFRLSRAGSTQYSLDRGQFLRGNWRGVADCILPPWAPEGDLFFKKCTACGECIKACPEGIIRAGKHAYPQVDFQRGECTFCGDCERACTDNALHDVGQRPWYYHVQVNHQCLALQGVMCRTCGDCCDTRAITFKLAVGGFSTPELNLENCTGCGACLAPCPTGSIEITLNSIEN